MTSNNRPKTSFSAFEFDLDRLSLYHKGQTVKIERKALEVLEVLLHSAGQIVSSQEIIDRVWQDNPHGVTPIHLAQCISKLRKAFAQFEPDATFVETVRGSGYVFSHPLNESTREPVQAAQSAPVHRPGRSIFMGSAVAGLIAIVAFSGFTAWRMYPADDK
nr:winged helix-turn-helix domain-containing protein [Blastocatellia bacterium]